MPKPKLKKQETTTEFQRREFPKRIKAVRKRVREALKADKEVGKGQVKLSIEQRGKHLKALRAANRVAKRMGLPPERADAVQPDKPKAKADPEKALVGLKDLLSVGDKIKRSTRK